MTSAIEDMAFLDSELAFARNQQYTLDVIPSLRLGTNGPKRKRELLDPDARKARQAEKNRETARRFRVKMENLRIYLEEQVVSLMTAYRTLMLLVLKFGKTPVNMKPLVYGARVRRSWTSHF